MARTPHLRYVRRRKFKKQVHRKRQADWLTDQAARLEISGKTIWEDNLVSAGMTAQQVTDLRHAGFPTLEITGITGDAIVANTLTVVSTATGTPTPVKSFQWLRDDVVIVAATSETYLLDAADLDAMITCTVTATNDHGVVSATSGQIGPITAE